MFIGQDRIVNEVDILLQEMKLGKNYNILFRAPSGYGKTHLALLMAAKLGWKENCAYYLCTEDNFNIILTKRIHILDEIHLTRNPEFLYPLMDSNNFIFILCTNESGVLKEPLSNRCINFIFEKYSDNEMLELVSENLNKYGLSQEILKYITEKSRGVPRYAVTLCKRLDYFFKYKGVPSNIKSIENIVNDMGIFKGGFTVQDRIYLNALERSGRMSLDNLSRLTNIDKATILRDIEPFLLEKNLIRITSRGRECILIQ